MPEPGLAGFNVFSSTQPLYTLPKPPSPRTVSALKFLVAARSSVKVKVRRFGAPRMRPSGSGYTAASLDAPPLPVEVEAEVEPIPMKLPLLLLLAVMVVLELVRDREEDIFVPVLLLVFDVNGPPAAQLQLIEVLAQSRISPHRHAW